MIATLALCLQGPTLIGGHAMASAGYRYRRREQFAERKTRAAGFFPVLNGREAG